ncbi:basic amino acid/polyamine antiporter [Chitinimonas sp. PSY-7]|uniref:basic amino acid/polyamine antiporter n=1 Tax=Chitinimonas sp. PSY-7 TaxID=3459088 RepID=UPI0040403BE5
MGKNSMNTTPPSVTPAPNTLSFSLLVAVVVGSILGGGIYDLPQNMASKAGAGANLIGWTITGIGMLMLARTYQILALRKPELDNGVYAYAQALSGEYVGFNSAWGYWVSAWVGNVGYLVAAFGALGYFFPAFGDGNSPFAILGASIALWVVHMLVLRGIHGAAILNGVVTLAKVIPLVLFIVLVAAAFQPDVFKLNFWGSVELGSLFDQVRSTMLITVWVFIGIEGASVYSARARRREDIGRATVLGFLICLLLMMAVSVLSLGIYTQPELARLKTPSMAGVLERVIGTWGAVVVYVGLLLSVGGGFLAWTLLAAESLFTPAQGGVMPRWLTRQNAKGVPANAMWLTNGMVQIFLIVTLFSKASYLALISLSTAMILVPYLLSAAYSLLLVWRSEGVSMAFRRSDFPVTVLATGYCLWLLYAAGLKYLLLGSLLYAPGAAFYLLAKKQRAEQPFSRFEWGGLALLLLLAAVAVYLLSTNKLGL